MELRSFRPGPEPEPHVAQQSRRDKLRVQQSSTSSQTHPLDDYSNLDQNPDLVQVPNIRYGNICYNPAVLSSQVLNFATNSQVLLSQKDPMVVPQENPQGCGDWLLNYSSESSNPNPLFVNGVVSPSNPYLKTGFNAYQDVHSSLTNPTSEASTQKHYNEMHLNSLDFNYQSTPLDLASLVHQNTNNQWTNSRELRTGAGDPKNTQSLSLSLSPVIPSKPHESHPGEDLQSGSKIMKPADMVAGSSNSSFAAHRNVGPLGPFTGYATILKGSRFLRPAQQLLDEICSVSARASEASESVAGARGGGGGGGDSGVTSTYYGSNEIDGEGGGRFSSGEAHRPEYQQKKAKLLLMQDEVCRRYKQYHQQMQMVVSSFETVAGLSSATPYISSALKTVSRHFRGIKNAISDQIRHVKKALGEDLSSPTTGTSSSKVDASSSRLKLIDQGFGKQRSGMGGFFEPQQHVWRPQRGLPERSVAILRAWLFDHFLHPYPTDTDKHMLATQTGLSRNQVSNWFINARVRVWKPMVEEIHMLETKGLAETSSNAGRNERKITTERASRPNPDQPINNLGMTATSSGKQTECMLDGQNTESWNQEKRSRVECQISDGTLMGFMPYQRSGFEMGGVGAVSLTLGLRQSAETAQQQHQHHHQFQQEHEFRQHFGGQMIHDFVG
ncbi:hypothetical protein NMG60_11015670 [Bertholletia excelsa]